LHILPYNVHLHAAPGGFPSHVSTGQSPSHSFVMPIQGVEASYANLMGHCALLFKKPGTRTYLKSYE
ncbi:hypothetical protein P4646_17295, partial [Peribacillus simplex]|uniref:hypothetical protein n=1 Tax=Peribacillus simplex TaxID=1478 RepID=UPI002E22FE15|nr:hypothetical protein [Peribacillus simplex]